MNGYKVNAEYVLRPQVKKKRIKAILTGYLLFLILETYLIANYLSFCSSSSVDGVLYNVIFSFADLFQPLQLTFSANLFKQIMSCHLRLIPLNLFIVALVLLNTKKFDNYRGVEDGSARFADDEEKRMLSNPDNAIPVADGLYVPVSGKLKNINEIVIGDTGAGKSFRKIIPDILAMFGSYVITDTKGGALYRQTSEILKSKGYKIRVLNLSNLIYSNTFNPLIYIETDEDIDKLVNTFIENSRKDGTQRGEAFWEDNMAMLMSSIISYLRSAAEEDNTFARIMDLVNTIKLLQGQIDPYSEYDRIIRELERTDPFNPAVLNYKMVIKAPPETLLSVITSLTSRLRLWANPNMRILSGSDEMDIDSIGKEKTAVYMIIPDNDNTYKCVSSMFINTLFTRLYKVSDTDYNGKLPLTVSFELDEFANIGKIPNFDGYISTMRSRNMRTMIVLQSLQQLEKNYDKADKTIISNCAIFNYLGTDDPDTRKKIVERLGKTTIEVTDKSRNIGGRQGGGSESDKTKGRELLTADELALLPSDKSIVFVSGFHPFFTDKFQTQNHPLFSFLGNDDINSVNFNNNADIFKNFAQLVEQHKEDYEEYKKSHAKEDFFIGADSEDDLENFGVMRKKINKTNFESELYSDGDLDESEAQESEMLEEEFATRFFLDELKNKNK